MKRTILAVAMLTAFGSLQAAMAQDAYPNRLIKLIVPFAAGGNTDVVGRVTAAYMQKAMKANVVVENRAGAGGINGTDVVAKAAPTDIHFAFAASVRSRSRRRPRSCRTIRSRTSLRSAWSTPIR